MSNTAKLGIATGLGVLAAILNMVYLRSREAPDEYVALKAPLEQGARFPKSDDGYETFPLPKTKRETSAKTLIPFNRVAMGPLYGSVSARKFVAGEPVFYRDIQTVPRYETLGPFTLLSVGDRFTGDVDPQAGSSSSSSVITVAPELEPGGQDAAAPVYNDKTRRLLQIIDSLEKRDHNDSMRIIAIVAHPANGATPDASAFGAGDLAPVREAGQAIFVPIQSLANVPSVLQIGTQISFVVPAFP